MAYNFLGLVNDVVRAVNEVELTSTTFPQALGFYSHAKDSVNSAIQAINRQEIEWPFNHSVHTQVLTPGQVRYSLPSNMKSVDWDTFRLVRDNSLSVVSRKLSILDYDEYLDRAVDTEYDNLNTGIRGIPNKVFRTPDLKFGVYPPPDQAYSVDFEYFSLPTPLSLWADVPTIPENYRYVILDGALYYVYVFRGDTETAGFFLQKFNSGIKDMRIIAINRQQYVRSSLIYGN
jgi:hypothetical protein